MPVSVSASPGSNLNRASSGWRTLLYGYLMAVFGLLLAIAVSS